MPNTVRRDLLRHEGSMKATGLGVALTSTTLLAKTFEFLVYGAV